MILGTSKANDYDIIKPAESNGTYSVVAEFIVEKDGSISDPQIIRGSNE